MEKIKFVKYNKTRREEFQIKTSILEENGTLFVEKSALKAEGIAHIRSFSHKYSQLTDQHPFLSVQKPVISEDGSTVRFPYLTGSTMAEELGREIQGGKAPIQAIGEAMSRILAVTQERIAPFHVTPDFKAVFGDVRIKDQVLPVTNIDALFENIMIVGEELFCLDYEWVFSFPVPLYFVKYRILYYFYEKYHSIMEGQTLEGLLAEFSITAEMREVYGAMEKCFQNYVHGENQQIYLLNYMADVKTEEDCVRTEESLREAGEHIRHLDFEIEDRDVTIKKQQEILRLTNNHVTNLEIMIGDLRRENAAIAQTLTYLNSHEAYIYKIRRKLGGKVNEKFPKGTRKRKLLSYTANTFLHPLRSMKLYFTKEGRNLIEGDLKIGAGYLERGKLVFPKEESPVVSVVIPVYNQIDYTYMCLSSILEHTQDVAYEIIIADDVSQDATMELHKFAENITICRNETNQGFLRNCNHAAKSARGRYIMFLNNDTKVTPGWLSSLVTLIESDKTIGMVGSKLVYPDGRLQEAGGIIWSDGSGWNYGRLDDPDKPEYNYVKDVDYISGAAILLSTALWKQSGGFDSRFAPAYCEDSDLAFSVRKAGYRVVYQPLSKVIHFEGISNGTDVNGNGLKRYQIENSRKLKEKWAAELKTQSVNTGDPDPFHARERSQGKPMILVVDHYVPTYDRDAGSKTTFQYLKMFLKKGYMIKFLGDNFLHEEPYSTQLQQMGIEILYGQEYQIKIWDWLKEHGGDIAYAYLNRPHIAAKYVDFIKDNTSMKIIYYGHDLHFLREGREYQLSGNPEKKAAAEYWKSIEFSLMRKAAVSYYPSCIEREAINEIDPQVKVRDIIAYVYDQFPEKIPDDFEMREGLLFVGGFAHPPNADAVLWFAKDIYPHIRQSSQIPFYIVGSKVTEEIQNLEQPGNGIVVKGFVSEEELTNLYNRCRMVVVPLRYGAGVKGKVIEALYYGAPIVTTSIGSEGIPEADSVMAIADQPEEFARDVLALYEAPETLALICRKSQEFIRKYYSLDGAWDIIAEDFGSKTV